MNYNKICPGISLLLLFILPSPAADSFDLLAPAGKKVPQSNLAFNRKISSAISWNMGQKSSFWLLPLQRDWSGYNAISFRIRSSQNHTAQLLLMLTANPKGSTGNYYYRKLEVSRKDWKTYTLPFSKLDVNKTPAGFADIQNLIFHSKGWGLKNTTNTQLEIDSLKLLRLSGEELKKPLPQSADTTCWPEEESEERIKMFMSKPDFPEKLAAIERMRSERKPDSGAWIEPEKRKKEMDSILSVMDENGVFRDLDPVSVLNAEKAGKSPNAVQNHVEESICIRASNRLSLLLKGWNNGMLRHSDALKARFIRSLIHYFDLEHNRNSYRWIASCFLMPKTAAEAYFTFIEDMNSVEKGQTGDPAILKLNRLCKAIAMQSFTQPERTGITDVLTVQRFRGNPHWVGGNFGYRPLLDCALICRNPAMVDVIVEVCDKALSVTSWNTRGQAFWTEGITADKAGWGHGVQNYLFGYPLDGLKALLSNQARLYDTPWQKLFAQEKTSLALDYMETLLWYCYNPSQYGATLMAPGRIAMRYYNGRGFSPYPFYMFPLLEKLCGSNPRLERLVKIAKGKLPEPSGIRYFWNNDDMLARRHDYFIGINMVSSRSASNEVVGGGAVKTEYLGDGATFLMKRPETYTLVKGFWDYTAIPGVTARQAQYEHPRDIWEGFSGCHNFAGGVEDGSYGVCSFFYEKKHGYKYDVPELYGVTARKSYFLFEDEMLCIGSDIRNKTPELHGTIRTTLDQTEWSDAVEYSTDGGKTIHANKPDAPFRISGSLKESFLVCHAGIGYMILPTDAAFTFSGESRKERWLEYDRNHNSRMTERIRELPVLQLQIDHGPKVKNGAYAYLIHMRVKRMEELAEYSRKMPCCILRADSMAHAVENRQLKIIQAVFFTSGASFSCEPRKWISDTPALVMIREHSDGSAVITASDPEQNPAKHHVTLTCDVPFKGKQKFVIPLPAGENCGKTGFLNLRIEKSL